MLAWFIALLPSRAALIGWGVAGAALIGIVTGWSIHEYNKGWLAAVASYAAKDKEAVDAVNKALARVHDCVAAGGVWRVSTGDCER